MSPVRQFDEESNRVYERVHEHSPGMVSVAYQPPTAETLRAG